jgi:hypothetical protein
MKIQPLQPEAGAFTAARNLHTACQQMRFRGQENYLTGLGNSGPNRENNIKTNFRECYVTICIRLY